MIIQSTDIPLDTRLGISKHATLVSVPAWSFCWKVFWKFFSRLVSQSLRTKISFYHEYHPLQSQITTDDVVFFTGGDTLCYDYNYGVDWMNSYCHDRGIKTFMWGCSFGKENMKPQYEEMFRKMTGIYVRESLSYQTFKELGLNNVYIFPDPAFVLKAEKVDLPECFDKEVVSINLSNYTSSKKELYYANVRKLVDYILSTTDMNILLFPHVFWKSVREDDQIICRAVKEMYKDNNRVVLLDGNQYNYCQLRYIISKSRFFIGARTHSVISAYSMCVPTIALGYSIKSRGIAKDVGLDSCTVVDCKNMFKDDEILNAFKYILVNEDAIRKHMKEFIPEYCKKAYEAKNLLK